MSQWTKQKELAIQVDGSVLHGTLSLPRGQPLGLVIFAHGSGSSRFSSRNRFVANVLNEANLATLLFDLLTEEESVVDQVDSRLRFNIPMLAQRLSGVVNWAQSDPMLQMLRVGLFGASTGAAAALMTAAQLPDMVAAVVSRGGRPDLADQALTRVQAPTLLIVGGQDHPVLEMNRHAAARMVAQVHTSIVPHATHLFEERGALEQVAELARDWFVQHLSGAQQRRDTA